MTRLLATVAALLLALPAAAAEVHGSVSQTGGEAVPGAEVELAIELSWPGRPDTFVPATPKLPVAKGGALRLETKSSSFDGSKTTWTQTATVRLPERGERWQMGPGLVVLTKRGGGVETVELAPLILGASPTARLIGQGIGSGAVVLFAVGWLWRRDRQLALEEAEVDASPLLLAARAALAADPFDGAAAIEALRALRLDLEPLPVDNAAPAADALQERLEAVRYGGEEIARATCMDWLAALEAAANGGRG